ncbi:unnamed protein product [Amoebophrya sp. A120]|nr:unnamed protein product [Amoebophrya sp. A120]|eukprot:GSA120T00001999001.1
MKGFAALAVLSAGADGMQLKDQTKGQSVLSLLRKELKAEVKKEVALESKKFVKDWHPKMAFVQYKRQDCTNGLHGIKVEFPCLTEFAKKDMQEQGVTETNILAHYDTSVTDYMPPGRTEACRWGKPKMHAVMTKAEAGSTMLQLDLAAEMCSKNKDCGGFVHFNEDLPDTEFPSAGLDIKIRSDTSSGANVAAATAENPAVTYVKHNTTAKPGDVVFLMSSSDCSKILFDPTNTTVSMTADQCKDLADPAKTNPPKTCKTGCVRASHCKEDAKENTYIKKRIIMADFGSQTEDYLTAADMYEGQTTSTSTTTAAGR